MFTRSRQNRARSRISSSLPRANIFKGNITFANTVSESKRALLWKSMPISCRMPRFSSSFMSWKERPL